MPTFTYQPLTSSSAVSGGGGLTIDAPDRPTAIRLLRAQGITPQAVEQIERSSTAHAAARDESPSAHAAPRGFGRTSMSRTEMASFVRELATAVQAGLPLISALRTIARSHRSPRQAGMLANLIDRVEHGRSLSDAAAAWGKPFNNLTVSMVRAGEMSGRLGEVLEQAANLLERDASLRRAVTGALIYPALLGVLIAGAITVIVTVIVPRILDTVSKQLTFDQLPWPTKVVMIVSDFMTAWWWALALLLAAALVGFQRLYRNPGSRLAIDAALLKTPLIGKVVRESAVARFTRTLATLVSAGLPALTALRITRGTLGNKAMERVVGEVCEQVAAGKTIADPMERSGYFPPLLTQVIALGERTGRLPQMLDQAARVFDERTRASVGVFVTVFPPLLVVVAAVVVGFVVAAVILPLIEMQEAIG